MTSGIYKIINTIDGKVYIGASINVENRLTTHRNQLIKGKHKNKRLQEAFDCEGKYFRFDVLEIVTDKNAIKSREQYYIDLFESSNSKFGYNRSSQSGYSHVRQRETEMESVYNEFFAEKFRELRDQLAESKFEIRRLEDKLAKERKSKISWKNKHQSMLLEINRNPYLRKAVKQFEEEENEKVMRTLEESY